MHHSHGLAVALQGAESIMAILYSVFHSPVCSHRQVRSHWHVKCPQSSIYQLGKFAMQSKHVSCSGELHLRDSGVAASNLLEESAPCRLQHSPKVQVVEGNGTALMSRLKQGQQVVAVYQDYRGLCQPMPCKSLVALHSSQDICEPHHS